MCLIFCVERPTQDPKENSLMPKPLANVSSTQSSLDERPVALETARLRWRGLAYHHRRKEGNARTELAEAAHRRIYIAHSIRLERSTPYAHFSPSQRSHARVDRYHANSKQTQKHTSMAADSPRRFVPNGPNKIRTGPPSCPNHLATASSTIIPRRSLPVALETARLR